MLSLGLVVCSSSVFVKGVVGEEEKKSEMFKKYEKFLNIEQPKKEFGPFGKIRDIRGGFYSFGQKVVEDIKENPDNIFPILKASGKDAGLELKCVRTEENGYAKDVLAYFAVLLTNKAKEGECDTKPFKKLLANHWNKSCDFYFKTTGYYPGSRGNNVIIYAEMPARVVIGELIVSGNEKQSECAKLLDACLKANKKERLKKQQQKDK